MRHSPVRVLVIDDNHDNADSSALLLALYGCDVEVAYSSTQALAAACDERPDVVICDIGLPGINGWELARLLREKVGLEHALLIALTALDGEANVEHSRAAGFDYHLVKPADPEALHGIVTRWLEEHPSAEKSAAQPEAR
jgi:CheY-like chemotaxis protein